MITVSATSLRSKLFDYLDKAVEGETIIILRNNQEVARLVPTRKSNWRDQMSSAPKLLVSPEEVIKPIDDIWDEHI